MATISNLSFVEKSQKAVNSVQGWADSIKPFSVGFNGSTLYGNAVAVPVFSAGTPSTSLSFATDSNSSTVFSNITINLAATHVLTVPAYQYVQIDQYNNVITPGTISKVLNQVTDAAYAMFNTTNWPLASNKILSAGWAEATPTIAALMVAVEAAKATKKLDKNNIKVLMPSSTWAVIESSLLQLPRDVVEKLGFEIVPVYASSFAQTAITDGSAVGIAIGQDIGTPDTPEEFDFLTDANTQFGIGFHKIGDGINRNVIVGLSTIYGVSKLNATGFKWIAAS